MKKIIFLIMAVLMAGLAVAYTTTTITAPTGYSTATTTAVNISGGVNASGFSFLNINDTINVTILNKSSSGGEYGILAASLPLTLKASGNRTDNTWFWNYTATLNDGERHWIKLNFTNVSRADDGSYGGAATSASIIDIDTEYYKLKIGNFNKLNFTLNTGLIQSGYGYQAGGAAEIACGATTRGLIIYNSTQGFIGCTDSGWKSLNAS